MSQLFKIFNIYSNSCDQEFGEKPLSISEPEFPGEFSTFNFSLLPDTFYSYSLFVCFIENPSS